MKRVLIAGLVALACTGCKIVIQPGSGGGGDDSGTYGGDSTGDSSSAAVADDGGSSDATASEPPPGQGRVHRTYTPGASERPGNRYGHLAKLGPAYRYFRNHGSRAQVDQGLLEGDCQFDNAGLAKRGAGVDKTVIDGDVEINGDNWMLQEMTITGDVKIRGSNNDLSTCKILGEIDVRGLNNKLP